MCQTRTCRETKACRQRLCGDLGQPPQAVLGKVGGLEGGNPRFRVEGLSPSKTFRPLPSGKKTLREEPPEQKKPPNFAALTRGKPKGFPVKSEPLEMFEDTAKACVLCSVFCVLCSVFCVQLWARHGACQGLWRKKLRFLCCRSSLHVSWKKHKGLAGVCQCARHARGKRKNAACVSAIITQNKSECVPVRNRNSSSASLSTRYTRSQSASTWHSLKPL